MLVDLVFAERSLSLSEISSGHSRVQSESSAVSDAFVVKCGVKFKESFDSQYGICQSVSNLMSSEWRSNNHSLSE